VEKERARKIDKMILKLPVSEKKKVIKRLDEYASKRLSEEGQEIFQKEIEKLRKSIKKKLKKKKLKKKKKKKGGD